ncbi:MAG: Omp28-related outer membrane protein [Bacteroidales bacterium]|nr:Omp28-related outer membrane protein [Bacteroidales bacterium]
MAVIEYHNGDSYVSSSGTSRLNYYGISSFPTAYFDGISSVVGGSATNSMYSTYLPHYEQRKAIPSAYALEVTGTHEGLMDFEIEVTMEKVAEDDNSNIKLHLAVTESHIEESWHGMDEVNFVERLMAPSSNGTNVDFTEDDVLTETLTFSLQEDWVVENCELVIFLQNNSSKEILQGKKLSLTELPEQMHAIWH